ncbi:hypothetical protein [Micromonospora sp. WMMD1155]|uniref:hypothetical protein n=1 Tax=Micromonospora sp. WMMD1155 TaxID=3016094 RepID=UPI00249AD6D8|nr:hypothetical protein [Micromonospora sp. WMMD1155]WFE53498.1 hypothetical protein O7617_25640 [Micromonospora sp. WMMD1155]
MVCLKTPNSGVRFTAPVTGDYLVRVRYGNAMAASQTMTLIDMALTKKGPRLITVDSVSTVA